MLEDAVIEMMTFHKDFGYSTKIGVSFGNTNWLARDIKIEIFDVSTGVYEQLYRNYY
jgi:hypothetical protein